MKAVVTGATGFIGSHLGRHLIEQGWEVHVIGRGDSVQQLTEAIRGFAPDAVFHLATHFLAAQTPDDIDPLIEGNVAFGTRVLEACKGLDVAFVNVGTIWQHYDARPYSPVSLYGATKQAFTDIARFYAEVEGLRVVNVELSDTYGPGDKRRKVAKLLMEAARDNTPLQMSPGGQLMFMLHVDDVVNALISATEFATTEAPSYALTPSDPVTLKELAERVGKVIGKPVPVEFGAREYRPREMMTSWHVSPVLPTWNPKVSLDEGLAELWADVQSEA